MKLSYGKFKLIIEHDQEQNAHKYIDGRFAFYLKEDINREYGSSYISFEDSEHAVMFKLKYADILNKEDIKYKIHTYNITPDRKCTP